MQSGSDRSSKANSRLRWLRRELLAAGWLPQGNLHGQEVREPPLPKSAGWGPKQHLFLEGLSCILLCSKGTRCGTGHCYAVWPRQALQPVVSTPASSFPSCRPPLPRERLFFFKLTQRPKAAVFSFPKDWAKAGPVHSRDSAPTLARTHAP